MVGSTVDSLLNESKGREERPSPQGRRGKGRRKGEKLMVSPIEMQNRVIRLSLIIVVLIAVVGYVARYVRRASAASEVWNNGIIDFAGLVAMGAALFLLVRASRVGGLTKERTSSAERDRMKYVTWGGLLLWMVPILGSFGYYFGIVFQTSNMHWLFYMLVGGAGLSIMYGLSGSKERGSFYQIFMFGVYGVVLATIPMALPVLGDVLASTFWWSSTFMMVSVGFILMALMVRQMRADQYAQLESVLEKADQTFVAHRFDEAQRYYSQAITLTHTLYSDQVFAARNPRERGGPSVPDEYFRPWIGKAKCLALTGKLRKALAIYDLMLEVDPDNPTVWFDRGRILVAEKRYAEAYISFDRALKLDPRLEEANKARLDVLEVIRKMAV